MLERDQGNHRHPQAKLTAIRTRRGRLAASAAGAALGLLLLLPTGAGAHGLVQRANLPIPEWLFGMGRGDRPDRLLRRPRGPLAPAAARSAGWRPLPAPVGRRSAERAGIALRPRRRARLLALVLAGPAGVAERVRTTSDADFRPHHLLGRPRLRQRAASATSSRAFSPWRALGRLSGHRSERGFEPRPYPDRLGRWPAAVGLLAFTWIELVSGWSEDPRMLAIAALGYRRVLTGRWRSTASSPGQTRRDLLGLLRPPLAHLALRDARPGGGPAPTARRPAEARRPARHRGVRPRDDRHRHL